MNSDPLSWESSLCTIGELASAFPSRHGDDSNVLTAVGLTCKALGAQVGGVLSLAGDYSEFVIEELWHDDQSTPVSIAVPLNNRQRTVVRQVVQTRNVQLIESPIRDDVLFESLKRANPTDLGSAMIAPLTSEEKLTGCLFVGRLKGAASFTPSDVLLLQTLATVLSLLLRNLTLSDEIDVLTKKLSRADAQLLQSAKLAATGKLAASIAHEINNPLQSVQSCIYLVADSMAANGPNRQYLDIAREELDRIAKIVQRLADLYRPSQEGLRETDLNGLLENVFALMGKRLQQNNVKLKRFLTADLPPIVVVADQIKQVSFNLMLNAMEAMPDGGELRVRTRFVREQTNPRIEVIFEDTGVGIAPEALERIFDPFYTTKAKGTGLGLSISYDIVERHGGELRVESTVGQGSVFTVSLPFIGRDAK